MTNCLSKMILSPWLSYIQHDHRAILRLIQEGSIVYKQRKKTELRDICNLLRLKVGGNKQDMIHRIEQELHRIKSVHIIQRMVRGFLVRCMQRLRGPGFPYHRNSGIVVNDCDFYTLIPFSEMSPHSFFSYEDKQHFVYAV